MQNYSNIQPIQPIQPMQTNNHKMNSDDYPTVSDVTGIHLIDLVKMDEVNQISDVFAQCMEEAKKLPLDLVRRCVEEIHHETWTAYYNGLLAMIVHDAITCSDNTKIKKLRDEHHEKMQAVVNNSVVYENTENANITGTVTVVESVKNTPVKQTSQHNVWAPEKPKRIIKSQFLTDEHGNEEEFIIEEYDLMTGAKLEVSRDDKQANRYEEHNNNDYVNNDYDNNDYVNNGNSSPIYYVGKQSPVSVKRALFLSDKTFPDITKKESVIFTKQKDIIDTSIPKKEVKNNWADETDDEEQDEQDKQDYKSVKSTANSVKSTAKSVKSTSHKAQEPVISEKEKEELSMFKKTLDMATMLSISHAKTLADAKYLVEQRKKKQLLDAEEKKQECLKKQEIQKSLYDKLKVYISTAPLPKNAPKNSTKWKTSSKFYLCKKEIDEVLNFTEENDSFSWSTDVNGNPVGWTQVNSSGGYINQNDAKNSRITYWITHSLSEYMHIKIGDKKYVTVKCDLDNRGNAVGKYLVSVKSFLWETTPPRFRKSTKRPDDFKLKFDESMFINMM